MTEKEEQATKLIRDFKQGKITRFNFEIKLRELGIEFPSEIIRKWELE
jgi:hypothetical protein